MNDLRAEYRPHADEQHRYPRREWYDSQWSVFWTVVGAIMTATALSVALAAALAMVSTQIAFKSFSEVFGAKASQIERPAPSYSGSAPVPAPPQPTPYSLRHLPQTHEFCIGKTAGQINEQYEKCRSGWVEV
ncbi:MAG TPA: hypothetical protein VFV51_05325, partial [Vicinamibacterales bacterium]|nr:hypothetical protein [Vicinamibacterales bacterium]